MPNKTKQSNKTNIPELRFPGFFDLWKQQKFREVFDIKAGGDIDKKNVSKIKTETFKYPIFANSDKKKGLYGYSDIYRIDYPCITVTGRGNLGVANARFENFYPIVRLLVLKPKKNSDIKFFEYSINKTKFFIESTGVPQLTGPQISSYKISIPSLPEQQKIADFLSTTDQWIENLESQKKDLEKYKKGMMQKIFSQEIRFKTDDGKNFPEWEEKRLDKIGKTFNGLSGKNKNDFGVGKYFITYKQIFDDSSIDIDKFSLVNVKDNEKQNKVKFGDVLFTTSSETPSEVGFSSVLLNKDVEPYLNSFSFGLRPNSFNELNPYFARFFFRSQLFRKKIVRLAQGSTRFNISKIAFMKISILLPKEKEQQKIADFLTNLDNLINLKDKQISRAGEWKKGLMQRMFV